MSLSAYPNLLLQQTGKVLTVTINRPDKMNAINQETEQSLARLFFDVSTNKDVHVVILTGAGKAFSAGGDFHLLQHLVEHPEEFSDGLQQTKQMLFAMLDCPKVVIAQVNGDAIGLGGTLALLTDIVVAAEHARIGDPHVKVGFTAGDGGAIIWPQLVGFARAKRYLLTGDLIAAPDAERIGLIAHCVPADALDRTVQDLAEGFAHGPIKAIQWTKVAINIQLKQLAHSMLDASVAYENLSNYTKDHAEAVRAFLEKRKPVFRGE